MAKPKSKIPYISFKPRDPHEMSSSQWHRIEQAYGHSLDSRGRKEIGDATNDFLYWIQGETDQGLMSDAIKQVERIGKNARSLLSAINDDSIPLGTRDY